MKQTICKQTGVKNIPEGPEENGCTQMCGVVQRLTVGRPVLLTGKTVVLGGFNGKQKNY